MSDYRSLNSSSTSESTKRLQTFASRGGYRILSYGTEDGVEYGRELGSGRVVWRRDENTPWIFEDKRPPLRGS